MQQQETNTRDEWKRRDLSAGGFSQITALSQGHVNATLEVLFSKHKKLKEIAVNKPKVGELSAKLFAPQLVLPVKGGDGKSTSVVYHCRFKEGTLKLAQSYNVKGWVLAFEVNFGNSQLTGPGLKPIKDTMGYPGDYSIMRLHLDFSQNKISGYRKDMSNIQDHLSGADQTNFLDLMNTWCNPKAAIPNDPNTGIMKDPDLTTLGYGLQTSKPAGVNPNVPTFPPTAMKHQIFRYQFMNRPPPEGLTDGNQNVVLFVEMTQNKPFPQVKPFGSDGIFLYGNTKGAMCLSTQLFWESYLLRNILPEKNPALPGLLQQFNQWLFLRIKPEPANFYIYYNNGFYLRFNAGMGPVEEDFPLGEVKKDPDFFKWKSARPPFGWRKTYGLNPDPPIHASLTKNGEEATASAKVDSSHFIRTAGEQVNAMEIAGTSSFEINFAGRIKKTGKPTFDLSDKFIMKWKTKMTLESVNKGGLQIKLHIPQKWSDWITFEKPPQTAAQDKGKTTPIKNLRDMLEKDWLPKLDNHLKPLTTKLQKDLATTSKYVLPGGNVFFMKNPIFTRTGDLLVDLSYDQSSSAADGDVLPVEDTDDNSVFVPEPMQMAFNIASSGSVA